MCWQGLVSSSEPEMSLVQNRSSSWLGMLESIPTRAKQGAAGAHLALVLQLLGAHLAVLL